MENRNVAFRKKKKSQLPYKCAMKHALRLWFLLAPLILAQDPDLADTPEFAHAMRVETRTIDGAAVVFQYGEVRPDFSSVQGNEFRQRTALDSDWSFRFDGQEQTRTVTLPHNWEAMPGANFWDMDKTGVDNPARFNGAGWYEHQFTSTKKKDRSYRLEFRGVRERARVWLNGQEVALHAGTGQAFSINVTKELLDGTNKLRVKVLRLPAHQRTGEGKWVETSGIHTLHSKAPDYWPYAGITGSVVLWEESPLSIRKVQVRNEGEELLTQVVVANSSGADFEGSVRLGSEILQTTPKDQKLSIASGAVRVITLREEVAPGTPRWSPTQPALHHLVAELIQDGETIDKCRVRFGLREFEVDGLTLRLNGEPTFLKGASAYNETPRGLALKPRENRAIFAMAKETDLNFVRLAVRQRAPEVYALADEMGLMVSGEWGGFWYQPDTMAAQTLDNQSIYQTMAQCGVWDLMNHPSVVLWCICNECNQYCPEYEPFLNMSRTLVRRLDGGLLPITWAGWHPHQGQPHYEHADIIGFNEYRGSLDAFEDLRPDMEIVTKRNPNKPIVIMENGSWSERGRRGRPSRRGTEDWQADLITRQWGVLRDYRPQLNGYVHWLLQDYRSRRAYTATRRKDGWSRMGLYSEDGEPKLARDVLRDLEMKE